MFQQGQFLCDRIAVDASGAVWQKLYSFTFIYLSLIYYIVDVDPGLTSIYWPFLTDRPLCLPHSGHVMGTQHWPLLSLIVLVLIYFRQISTFSIPKFMLKLQYDISKICLVFL